MQIKNIRGHRIRWTLLAVQGAVVGVLSAIVMLAITTLTWPLVESGADGWTFLKVVASSVLGEGAAEPLAGFEPVAVMVGLAIHLVIGAAAGLSYALLVAMFDLEGWTPVALFGLLYGAVLFVWSTVAIGVLGIGGAVLESAPLIVLFWSNVVFGLSAGVMLCTWADSADIDQLEAERFGAFEDDRTALPTPRH